MRNCLFILLSSLIFSHSVFAVGVFSCRGLIDTIEALKKDADPNSGILPFPFQVISAETQEKWIKRNLQLILDSKKLSQQRVADIFSSNSDRLISAGFVPGEPKVKISNAQATVDVYYSKQSASDPNKDLIVRTRLVLDLTTDGIRGLAVFYHTDFNVIGDLAKGSTIKNLEALQPNLVREFRENQSEGSWRSWRPVESHALIAHMRSTLNDLIVPLALLDPAVVSVGIEFPVQAPLSLYGAPLGSPQIFITRKKGAHPDILSKVSPLFQPFKLWDGKIATAASFAGIRVFYKSESSEGYEAAYREKLHAGTRLLVYDFSRVSSQQAKMQFISRDSQASQPIYYHHKTGTYELFPAEKNERAPDMSQVTDQMFDPYNFRKVTPAIRDRVRTLKTGGYNPLIKAIISIAEVDANRVTRSWQEVRVLTIRELFNLMQEQRVQSIREYFLYESSYVTQVGDL